MRKINNLLFYFLFLIIITATQDTMANAENLAPMFDATLFNGLQVNNATYKNKVVIINFWASWCEPCRKELPALEAFLNEHKDQGVQILTISMDDEEDIKKAKQLLSNYHFDNSWIGKAHMDGFNRIWRIPLTFVIDQHGQLVKEQWFSDSDNGLSLDMLNTALSPTLPK